MSKALKVYRVGFWIFGIISFFAIWIGTLFSWGFLGIVFGWLPGLIGGIVLGVLWPIIVLGILGFTITVFVFSDKTTSYHPDKEYSIQGNLTVQQMEQMLRSHKSL